MTTTIKTSIVATFAVVVALAFATSAFAATFISESKAISIAEAEYTGAGQRTDVELEKKQGTTVYAVEFTEGDGNEVDVYVDAETGDVVGMESDATEEDGEDEDDNETGETEEDEAVEEAEQAVLKAQAKVSHADALMAAEAAYTGSGAFDEMDLDDESGTLVWEVAFVDSDGNEVEVHIDAMIGDVLGEQADVENDDDDDEDDVTSVAGLQQKLLAVLQQLLSLLQTQR